MAQYDGKPLPSLYEQAQIQQEWLKIRLEKVLPRRGDVPLLPNTWCSVELQATTVVAEWGGQKVQFAKENDVALDSVGGTQWVLSRQTVFHLVK